MAELRAEPRTVLSDLLTDLMHYCEAHQLDFASALEGARRHYVEESPGKGRSRNGFTCQMCGLTPGEIDPATGRKVRLHIGHIKDKSLGGKDELSNLHALCSTCNQGAKNITAEKPTSIWLLSQVRRAGLGEQRAVFAWLRKKFGE